MPRCRWPSPCSTTPTPWPRSRPGRRHHQSPHPGRKLTSATARAPSKEGLTPSAVILDEVHLWISGNGGHRLAETLRRGVAKTGGRSLETSNMWASGQESVAEETADLRRGREGRGWKGDGVLRWQPIGHCEDLTDPDSSGPAWPTSTPTALDRRRPPRRRDHGPRHPSGRRPAVLLESAGQRRRRVDPRRRLAALPRP